MEPSSFPRTMYVVSSRYGDHPKLFSVLIAKQTPSGDLWVDESDNRGRPEATGHARKVRVGYLRETPLDAWLAFYKSAQEDVLTAEKELRRCKDVARVAERELAKLGVQIEPEGA
jgi:hypothetical protein